MNKCDIVSQILREVITSSPFQIKGAEVACLYGALQYMQATSILQDKHRLLRIQDDYISWWVISKYR